MDRRPGAGSHGGKYIPLTCCAVSTYGTLVRINNETIVRKKLCLEPTMPWPSPS